MTDNLIQDTSGVLLRMLSRLKSLPYLPQSADMSIGAVVGGSPAKFMIESRLMEMYLPKQKDESKKKRKQPVLLHPCLDEAATWLSGPTRLDLDRLITDPASPEVLLLQIPSPGLIVSMANDLASLREAALVHKKHIVVVAQVASCEDLVILGAAADETVLCKECEPDPEFSVAISMEYLTCENFFADGCGKVMVQVARGRERFKLDFQPFAASAVKDRVIWYLAAEEKPRALIANAVGLSIEQVDARLAAMRPLRHSHLPSNWHSRYAGAYERSANMETPSNNK
ncbi:hypothetical protein NWF24_19860 [Variovorax paradoxus]|uniref:hypothetical protein n=1 Tax=Variovorax paradoxus TaxID=34073 RepID=UPI0021ABAFD1|nr:hypothetical protein [Variovorax paradoxus]UVH55091.1 hypothetical protein NWF24_19860 [Variovorax paradoxus]